MTMIRFCFFIILCNFLNPAVAQSPYELSWKKDGGLVALGGISTGLGLYLRSNQATLTIAELEALNPNTINSFDRIATEYYSTKAAKASDFFWGGSHALPFLFLVNKKTRKDFSKISALYGETFFITLGLTVLVKSTANRIRPFAYNTLAPLDEKTSPNATTAFPSGHTSITAANCFFAAKIFADYFPDSKWKPVVWTSAAVIPAITGYLRVRAGKHFPTDTIAGYLLGASAGILIPHLHKKKSKNLSFHGGLNGLLVQVSF